MKLDDKGIEALAKIKMKAHKEIYWARKYTIPFYIGIVIVVTMGLIIITSPLDIVMVNGNGGEVIISNGESMVIDGSEYIRDKRRGEQGYLDILRYIQLGALALAGVAYYKWEKDLKRPYIKAFKKYYNKNEELME